MVVDTPAGFDEAYREASKEAERIKAHPPRRECFPENKLCSFRISFYEEPIETTLVRFVWENGNETKAICVEDAMKDPSQRGCWGSNGARWQEEWSVNQGQWNITGTLRSDWPQPEKRSGTKPQT
jgi:hypothetical protein